VEIDPLERNPQYYVFTKSESDVIDAVIEALGGYESSKRSKYENYDLHKYNISTEGYFKLLPVLYGNPSKVYFRKNGDPYLYDPATILIYVNPLNDNETEVRITVKRPMVRTQLTILPVLPHFNRVWKHEEVAPTTVEEYEILLMIGRELGEENMPELKIPEKIVL
jgi:hypothetical protein